MGTTPSNRRRTGARAAEDGMPRVPPDKYYSQGYIDDWLTGYDRRCAEMDAERAAEARERGAESMWRAVVIEPLAERFDATPELMEELFDAIATFIREGKKL